MKPKLNPEQILALDKASNRLRAIAHQLRISIIEYVLLHPNACVKEIYFDLGLEQSVCSQHLKILREAQLVISHKNGKKVHYVVDEHALEMIMTNVELFLDEPHS